MSDLGAHLPQVDGQFVGGPMRLAGLQSLLIAWAAASPDLYAGDNVPQAYLDEVAVHVKAGEWGRASETAERILSRDESLKRSTTWIYLTRNLETATRMPDTNPIQKQRRAEVAATVGLYELAMKYCKEWIDLLDAASQSAYNARMDVAQIAKEAGFDAARRRDYAAAQEYFEMVEDYGVTWVKELGENRARRIADFVKGSDSVAARVEFAKNFWIGKSPGEGRYYSDAIAFLEETLNSRLPISAEQRKDIYSTIRSHSFADPAQMRAWEARLLREFPEDVNMAAELRVEGAQKLHEAKDIEGALREYRAICENLSDTSSYGIAQFNVGWILKEEEKYEEAITEFEKLLASHVDDRERTGNIMAEFRNYRSRAQWEIGNCYRALGRYRDALEAYVSTQKKYPFQSKCGNARAEFAFRYALFQAICHEYLGEYRQASNLYWRQVEDRGLYQNPTIHLRLLDLYEAAGQRESLLKLLDAVDVHLQERVARELKHPLDAEMLERIRPSATIREAMRIRSLGTRHQWADLIAMCHSKGTTAGPEEEYARSGNWQGAEAVKLIARYPRETVPLLIKTARSIENQRGNDSSDGPDRRWLYYALGECGTDDAIAYLEERARLEENIWPLHSVIFSLGLAGDWGRERIEQLSVTAAANLGSAIRGWREGRFGRPLEFEFPPLPRTALLAVDLSEIETKR